MMKRSTAVIKWVIPVIGLLVAALGFHFFVPKGTALTIGRSIPELRMKDLDGSDFYFNDTRGKVLVLNLWATWCVYCREELRFLNGLAGEYGERGLQVVSVLKDVNNFDIARDVKGKNSLTYPILLDGGNNLFKAFGLNGLPFSVLADRTGKIRFIHLGFNARDTGKYTREILELLEEK